MTEQEAILNLELLTSRWEDDEEMYHEQMDISIDQEFVNTLYTAIKALEEVEQYRAIGTIEELEALKEKAEPKKVIDKKYNLNTSTDLDKLLGQKPDYERYPGCGYDRSWCG